MYKMFESTQEVVAADRAVRYVLHQDGRNITFGEAIELWSNSLEFRNFFVNLLRQSEFEAYRWETPTLKTDTVSRPFEFVLLKASSFANRATDGEPFQAFFECDPNRTGIVSFENLGKNATLIVPSPRTNADAYGHLAAFVRKAPPDQVDALWKTVGDIVSNRIEVEPIWLSTAGGGVAWLHVRIDQHPKYYMYSPYTLVDPE